jgi:hypothetical protein
MRVMLKKLMRKRRLNPRRRRLRRIGDNSLTRELYMIMEALEDYQKGVYFFLQDLDQCLRGLFNC